MAAILERRRAPAALWARRLSLFSAVLFIVAGVGHRYGLVETLAFLWLLALVFGLAVGGLILAAAGFASLWNRGDRAGRESLFATVVALLVLAPFIVSVWQLATLPQLADISTDLADPPRFAAFAGAPGLPPAGPIPASRAGLQREAYPEIIGRRYPATADVTLVNVAILLQRRGWAIETPRFAPAIGSEITVEVIALSPILRFPAYAAIRITDEGDGSYVDMRSASRYGRHDLGGNAALIAAFLADLDLLMAEEPGG